MPTDKLFQQASALVREPFEMETVPDSEEELIALLAERIAEMLERQPEYLMSMLYRLDVLEKKIVPVMRPDAPEPANWGLARLVLERQKERLETKRTVKIEPLEGMKDWEW
ncbi:MAG: hypothetical protein KIS77_16560 [Saprospiraceae bacterium]|nr:hypothetical protein [Saprospiraceae bacterium]